MISRSVFVLFLVGLLATLVACPAVSPVPPVPPVPPITDGAPEIRYNQSGYLTTAPKVFVVTNSEATTFDIIDASNGSVVKTGALVDKGYWTDAEQTVRAGDFSTLTAAGSYKIRVGTLESASFSINTTTAGTLARDLLRFYYYQRASMGIAASYAEGYSRAAGHADTSLARHSTSGTTTGTWSAPGGWYDAGDYGKYIVNGGIATATLMGLYDLDSGAVGDGNNIPESGNGKSDLLDELKYELDWFKSMQDTDGGVFFKVAAITWNNGWCMPADDPNARYLIGKSTGSTLNFAAVMAQASRVFASYDASWAADCLTRAESAWAWATSHASVAAPTADSANGGSGGYGDGSYDDEFLWAASELWIASSKTTYQDYVTSHIGSWSIYAIAGWGDTRTLGILSLAQKGSGTIGTSAKAAVKAFADTLLARIGGHPYGIPMQSSDFVWGSNGVIGNYGVILAYAWKQTGDAKYLRGIAQIADYLLGKNATGSSFVTGHGSKTPMNPHHRISSTDGPAAPVPGMVVGGPNPGQEDKGSSVTYPSVLPARSYVDDTDSYASNEEAINWNAPAVLMLYILDRGKGSL